MASRQWRSSYILKRAKKFMEQKLYEEAMIMLAEANHREPTLAEAFAAQGLCQLKLEQYNQETVRCFDRAIALKPTLKNAYYNRAFTKQRMALRDITLSGSGHTIPDAAAELLRSSADDYTKCIQLDRFFAEAYSNRAACFGKLRNTRRAAADLNKAGGAWPFVCF
jgi:tetratricopeptide (TPR) repeat protein